MVNAQNLKAELLLSSWTDISTYIYQRDGLYIQRGRQNEAATMQPGTASFTLNNKDGRFTTRNPTGAYYPSLVQNTPLRLSMPVADVGLFNHLRLETDLTSSASTPDKAALQITGPIDVRIDCWLSDDQPAVLLAKYGGTAKSWAFILNMIYNPLIADGTTRAATGTLGFFWFDGSNTQSLDSGALLPYFSGRIALRCQFTPSTGTAIFYTSATMAGPWTQLGTNQVFGATTLNAGVGQAVQVGGGPLSLPLVNSGGRTRTANSMLGAVYEAQVLSNVTLEADPVFSS